MRLLAPVALALVLLGACAQKPPVYTGWFKELNGCEAEYAEMDARVDAAGVRDATYYRVPGFPYLRTDRVLASYSYEVQTLEEVGGWVRRMREYDQEAREVEFTNLGMSLQERAIKRFRFLVCSRGIAGLELEEPGRMDALRAAVAPQDEYSGVQRALGLYPLTLPLLRARITDAHDRTLQEFGQPLTELDSPGPLTLWGVKPVEDRSLVVNGFSKAVPDELGFPGLVDSEWRALAEIHAPQFWIETAGAQDHPGAPMWSSEGASVDTGRPEVNYHISFTRFGGIPLAQISYFVWFPGADGKGIDGRIWRVTLDRDARPLVYENLHASGREHGLFPAQPLELRPQESYWQQAPLLPQTKVPTQLATLRLQAGTHRLRRVVAPEQVQATETRSYTLRRYEDLLILPLPGGGTRSLFGPDGQIPGIELPADPAWMLASGIQRPGALRQYGHHAITYIGRAHFDEPFLLESVFVPPYVAAPPG